MFAANALRRNVHAVRGAVRGNRARKEKRRLLRCKRSAPRTPFQPRRFGWGADVDRYEQQRDSDISPPAFLSIPAPDAIQAGPLYAAIDGSWTALAGVIDTPDTTGATGAVVYL